MFSFVRGIVVFAWLRKNPDTQNPNSYDGLLSYGGDRLLACGRRRCFRILAHEHHLSILYSSEQATGHSCTPGHSSHHLGPCRIRIPSVAQTSVSRFDSASLGIDIGRENALGSIGHRTVCLCARYGIHHMFMEDTVQEGGSCPPQEEQRQKNKCR